MYVQCSFSAENEMNPSKQRQEALYIAIHNTMMPIPAEKSEKSSMWGWRRWIKHPFMMLEVWGSNTPPSENTTSLPRSPRGSQRSQGHHLASELSVEAG